MSETGVEKKRLTRQGSRGFTLSEVLVILAFIGILAAIAIPNLPTTARTPVHRVASDTKWAVTQAIVYANDKGVYPTSLNVLREAGYAYVTDTDPWGNEYVLSPVLTEGREGGDVYVFSRGPKGTGVYPQPFTHDTGEDGSIGYSAVHGCWGPPLYPKKLSQETLTVITILIVVILCVSTRELIFPICFPSRANKKRKKNAHQQAQE